MYTPGILEVFLASGDFDNGNKNAVDMEIVEKTVESEDRLGTGGQPSITSKFPEIVEEVTEFVKQHGFSAQSRRRNETGYSSGVTIEQITLYSTKPLTT